MCFDHDRQVDLFTLYAAILQRRHKHIETDAGPHALFARLINAFFLRLHHIVVNQDMIEAAQTASEGIAQCFRQMYTKLAQTCFNRGCAAAGDLKVCSACLQAKYCSSVCQANDWNNHRTICSFQPVASVSLRKSENI